MRRCEATLGIRLPQVGTQQRRRDHLKLFSPNASICPHLSRILHPWRLHKDSLGDQGGITCAAWPYRVLGSSAEPSQQDRGPQPKPDKPVSSNGRKRRKKLSGASKAKESSKGTKDPAQRRPPSAKRPSIAATGEADASSAPKGKPAVQSAGVAPADPSNDASKEEAVSSPATMAGSTHQADKDNVSGQQQPIRPDNGLSDSMDIVFISAEVAPWSKTGGLGDVVGSLPIALARRGHRVMVVAPRYQHGVAKSDALYEPATQLEPRASLALGHAGQQDVSFYHLHRDGVDWVFVDHPCYHRPGNPYADQHGAFGDNQFRYALLSLAGCEAPLILNIGGHRSGQPPGFPYGENILFVANDWHAGLVPVYLAAKYRRSGTYKDARCIVAIHNLSHQGVEPSATYGNLGLPDDWYNTLSWEFPSWAATPGPAVNILKGGVTSADRIVTVSQGYAWEITTVEGGWGMDGVLQSRQPVLNGIVNGVDEMEWDPATDKLIARQYNAANLAGKAECKRALQNELGLPEIAEKPLLGFIGRLDHQKGPDIVLEAVHEFSARNCQVVMLGSGTEEYENSMRAAENEHSETFRGWVGFSVPVAHRIIAGCDIILMPSRFEPCGLNQLFAMRYGSIPIAHATGGLRDTIEDFNPFAAEGESSGTGWTYSPCDVPAMLQAVDLALQTFHQHKSSWQALMREGMTRDLSWNRAAEQYEQIFRWAFTDPPARHW